MFWTCLIKTRRVANNGGGWYGSMEGERSDQDRTSGEGRAEAVYGEEGVIWAAGVNKGMQIAGAHGLGRNCQNGKADKMAFTCQPTPAPYGIQEDMMDDDDDEAVGRPLLLTTHCSGQAQ